MDPQEQELLSQLKEANINLQYARSAMAEAKRKFVEAETNLINAKLEIEKINEQMRVFRNQQVIPGQHYTLYDEEG